MENLKESNDGANKENPVEEAVDTGDASASSNSSALDFLPQQPPRRPFTSLSQVDSDLALARTLQEQERAYMMLRMAGDQGEYQSSLSGSYVSEEDVDHLHENGDAERYGVDDGDGLEETNDENGVVGDEEEVEEEHYDDEDDDVDEGHDLFDMHASEEIEQIDPSAFESDEAYARALQDAEERQLAAQMLAFSGINEWESDDGDENGSNSQDTWQEVDPDDLSYEELLALGEAVGTESRGLAADAIASLPSSVYRPTDSRNGTSEQCVICRLDYEEGDRVIVLSCKHRYHSDCINNWLQINKVCPVCSTEVSTSSS